MFIKENYLFLRYRDFKMKTCAVPTAAAEVIEIIKNAISDDAPLEIICNGTKKSYGLTI